MTLFEVDEAATRITDELDDDTATIIVGSAHDATLDGTIRVSVVAAGESCSFCSWPAGRVGVKLTDTSEAVAHPCGARPVVALVKGRNKHHLVSVSSCSHGLRM